MCVCSFDLNKVAQAQGDKTARKQAQRLQRAAMDSLAEVRTFYILLECNP